MKSLLVVLGNQLFDKNYHPNDITDIFMCEDFDLWLRILTKYPIGFVEDECIIKYGGHEDQLSTKYKAMDHYRVKTFQKLLPKRESLSLKTIT